MNAASTYGIRVGSNCVAILIDCEVQGSGGEGIEFHMNATGWLRGNIVSSNNSGAGLDAQRNSSLTLDGVSPETTGPFSLTVNGNAAGGIRVWGSSSMMAYGATVTANGNQNYGVQVSGGSTLRLLVSSNWLIENGQDRGMLVMDGASFRLDTGSTLTVDNNKERGIYLLNSASLWSNGTLIVRNTTGVETDCYGILACTSSALFFFESAMTIQNNVGNGIHIRRGSNMTISNTSAGALISGNSLNGIAANLNSTALLYGASLTVQNNGQNGAFADDGSALQIFYSNISANAPTTAVRLQYGSRGTFGNTTLSLQCMDSSVISRGIPCSP